MSSYTQALNKQLDRTGSLFAHKTKAKKLNNFGDFIRVDQPDYAMICFDYINQNPLKSGLVKCISDWEYSFFKDYVGLQKGNLVNKKLAVKMLNLDIKKFQARSMSAINEEIIKSIF